MVGLIVMPNENGKLPLHSGDVFLRMPEWLALLAETFQRGSSLSDLQIAAYQMALDELTPAELDAACRKILSSWTFSTTMPTPAAILRAHEELRFLAHRWEEREERLLKQPSILPQPTFEELHQRGLEYCAKMRKLYCPAAE